jgi:hypothetical protein
MSTGRYVTPWFPVAVDPVHEGVYEVEYRQSRFIFRREWRDGQWCIPGAVLLQATRPKRWRGLTDPALNIRGALMRSAGYQRRPSIREIGSDE